MQKTTITVARGDGIGPEIMQAVLDILQAAKAPLEYEFVTLGEKAYLTGCKDGIPAEAWESIRKTRVLFKAPITTPQGGGYKSVNVTLRKSFGQYANVRPVRTFDGVVKSKHSHVDMVIVRENEEDLYAGIEYRQTLDSCHSVKLLSYAGSERICRYAFEYARNQGRKKVTCMIKDNIMKITDGMFHRVFQQVAKDYPDIAADSMIVDIGMARVADSPEKFDVIVTENLYGDIVSDIASQVAGSVGLAGSMNIGEGCAMFEAVHGSAPDIAGKGIANPGGLLNGAILMLYHLGMADVAATIGNAWLYTLENGQHTADIAADSKKALSTSAFAKAVIANLGNKPTKLAAFSGKIGAQMPVKMLDNTTCKPATKKCIGVDVFIDWLDKDAQSLGKKVERCATDVLAFSFLANRGTKMYPGKAEVDASSDLWACRFMGKGEISGQDIRTLLHRLEVFGLDWVKVEALCTFDGEADFYGKV